LRGWDGSGFGCDGDGLAVVAGQVAGVIGADFQVAGDALQVVTPQEFHDVDDDPDD